MTFTFIEVDRYALYLGTRVFFSRMTRSTNNHFVQPLHFDEITARTTTNDDNNGPLRL